MKTKTEKLTWFPGSWWWDQFAEGSELPDKQWPCHLTIIIGNLPPENTLHLIGNLPPVNTLFLYNRNRAFNQISFNGKPVRRLGVFPWNIPEMTSASFGPHVTIPKSKHMVKMVKMGNLKVTTSRYPGQSTWSRWNWFVWPKTMFHPLRAGWGTGPWFSPEWGLICNLISFALR